MPQPCRKCGATKTEPVRRGLAYQIAKVLGYRLRACSRCRRRRLLRENTFAPRAIYARKPDGGRPEPSAAFDPDGFNGCPRCGAMNFDRTPRNWYEKLRRNAPMARCQACNKRFTYPTH